MVSGDDVTETQATCVPVETSRHPNASNVTPLHIVCDRDVGLFNLILGVIPHTYWALTEGRIPIIYYGEKNCYWTPNGYRGRDTVWEYYFEPVIPEYPVSKIPPHVLKSIADNPPQRRVRAILSTNLLSSPITQHGTSKSMARGCAAPRTHKAPSRKIRELASTIVRDYIRPRDYIIEKANSFLSSILGGPIPDRGSYPRN